MKQVLPLIFGVMFVSIPIFYRYCRSPRIKLLLASLVSKSLRKMNFTTKFIINERDQSAVTALTQGQLPAFVQQRITEQNQGKLPWMSNLSMSEWLLLKQFKFRSQGMVMGAAHYHLAFSVNDYINDQKYQASYSIRQCSEPLFELNKGIRKTFELAKSRLQSEGRLSGAHAVVNIQIKTVLPKNANHQVEYILFGTAIILDHLPKPADPILCTSSAIDFIKLMQAGSIPVGLGIGICTYYDATRYQQENQSKSWRNQEIQRYSDTISIVRKLAMRNLQEDIEQYQGNGILTSLTNFQVEKIKVGEGRNKREDHVLQYICLGTIISQNKLDFLPKFRMVLDLTL